MDTNTPQNLQTGPASFPPRLPQVPPTPPPSPPIRSVVPPPPTPSFQTQAQSSQSNAFSQFPKVDVRTMVSDVKSIQEGGGGAPKPYVPDISAPKPSSIPTPPSASPVAPPPITQIRPPTPPTPPSGLGVKPMSKKSGSGKGVFALILTLIIVVGVGAAVYFFVLPLFKTGVPEQGAAPIVPPEQIPPAQTNLPAEPIVPAVAPPATETPTTTVATTPEPVTPTRSSKLVHVSLLKTPADLKSEIGLEYATVAEIRSAIEFTKADVASVKEVLSHDDTATPFSAGQFLKSIAPSWFTDSIATKFEDDFTFLVYTDSKGSWPVYLLKIKSGVDAAEADAAVKNIETVSANELANFFLADPGTKSSWRNGTAEGMATRYSTFSQAGAGFNYGRKDSVYVFGTSYTAFREAVKRLSE